MAQTQYISAGVSTKTSVTLLTYRTHAKTVALLEGVRIMQAEIFELFFQKNEKFRHK